ncbi:MAG: PLP-dependent aminotransferase family protein [Chloroflexota bacterium]
MAVNWQNLFTESARLAGASPLRDLLRFGSDPDLISMAGGFPAPELFPVDAFREAAELALGSGAAAALQYGPTEGFMPLRSFLAERLSASGIAVTPEEILITNGSQQGLDLVAGLLIEPGSLVAVEDPSYVGGLATFSNHQARYLVVSSDDDGMQVDALSELLQRDGPKPRLIYALPNFQNPGGSTLSLARRHQLLELSYRYGIPVLEDDPYGELRYEGETLPSLKSLDTEGNVIYLGSFSKILSPGVRLGWVVAHREVIERLASIKQGVDLNTNSLAQHVVYQVCKTGLLEEHVEKVKPIYRERRDAMLRAMAKQLPPDAKWSRPTGGLFIWAQLPQEIDTRAMLADAVREKVAYVPGIVFHPRGDRTNTVRLNFSAVSVPLIREGVRRLGRVTKEYMKVRRVTGEPNAPIDLAPTV